MKTVLFYGDSNTWGYDPATQGRFDIHTRWAGVARDLLGADWHVIEEGLGGRTTVWDDPLMEARNGKDYLVPCLATHRPLDVVCIMLGTNDLKMRFSLPASDIAEGAGVLAEIVLKSDAGRDDQAPPVVLMCPPPLAPLAGTRFVDMFAGGEAKSRDLARHYRAFAGELGCHFVDVGTIVQSSPLDAIHYEASEHRKLGEFMAAYLRDTFGG
jgi:lysophospholipase L1-like esterase